MSGVKRLVGKEIEVSTNLVAGALAAWQKAGAAAGDVKFWRMFVDQFDSSKAFQLVVEALLERGDQVASMALMLQWVSQVDRTSLEEGDASFHSLALRWIRAVEEKQLTTGVDQWPLVAKFFAHLESSADTYWQVPEFQLSHDASNEGDDDDSELDSLEADDDVARDADADDEPWDDDEDEVDELYGAAYEDMVYRDSTDDGFDADIIDEYTEGSGLELEEEAQRLGQRLEFLSTVAGLWRHAAITWSSEVAAQSDRQQLLDNWCEQAVSRYDELLELLETVHRFPIPQPTGSYDSMVEFDRQRMIKDSLVEQIIATCVETADASRLILATSGAGKVGKRGAKCQLTSGGSVDVLRGVLAGDAAEVARHWPEFTNWLTSQELLYVPLPKGGRPRRIVRARTLGQLLHELLGWLPRLGLVRETCQLMDIAQAMEIENPVGPGAVTEYDRLFTRGYQAIVQALVASAEGWDAGRSPGQPSTGSLRASATRCWSKRSRI